MRQYWWYVLVVGVLAGWLTGCAIDSSNSENGDIEAIESNALVAPASADTVSTDAASAATQSEAAAEFQGSNTMAVVRLQPASQQHEVGVLGIVQLRVENVVNFYGVEFGLQFDPNIIQIQDADPAQDGIQIQSGDFLSPDLVVTNQVDNATGNITYIVTQTTPPSSPVNGSGTVAVITFQTVAIGTSNLNFTALKLSDPDGNQIPANIQSGQIIVGSPGQATSTPTSTPVGPTATPEDTPTPTPTIEVATITPTFTPTPTSVPPTSTPLPPNMVIPPGATVGFCYRVELCETLSCVAQKFGVDQQYLNLVNDLSPPGYVFAHQALFIPTQYGRGPNVYIVEPGDTLVSIADACHLPTDFLAWVNCLEEDANLQPGHVLEIPIPPFPPPSRYAYPGSIAPSVPSNKPLPPPSVGCRGGCFSGACGSN